MAQWTADQMTSMLTTGAALVPVGTDLTTYGEEIDLAAQVNVNGPRLDASGYARYDNSDLPPFVEVAYPGPVPQTGPWRWTPILKHNMAGQCLLWQCGFDGISKVVSWTGRCDGAINSFPVTVVPVGGKTMLQQALQEATQRYKEMIRNGYADPSRMEPVKVKAMKADEYVRGQTQLMFPVWVQVKLNGVRTIVSSDLGGNISACSWSNTPFPHLTHVTDRLQAFMDYLPPETTLDGEMYLHGFSLQKIRGIVMSLKNIDPDLNKLVYNIFDIVYKPTPKCNPYWKDGDMSPTYSERYTTLINAYNRFVADGGDVSTFTIVPVVEAVNHEQIHYYKGFYISEGYEGIMIRKVAYHNRHDYERTLYIKGKPKGRNARMFKFKDRFDEEAVVVGILNSRGREEDAARLKLLDKRGNIVTVRFMGPVEERRRWLREPALVMGKVATFRYNELSEAGVPQQSRGLQVSSKDGDTRGVSFDYDDDGEDGVVIRDYE